MKNEFYELIKITTRYGKRKEQILCTSKDRFYLSELKKNHRDNQHSKFIVRSQIIKIKGK